MSVRSRLRSAADRLLDLGVTHRPRSTSHLFPDHVLPIAHRGWSGIAPENTHPAFDAAADAGYGIELDTTLTADGELVVIHDDSLDRTTTGTGPVDQHTYPELQALDAGSWFDPAFVGAVIPRLSDVLQRHGGHTLIDIEIKSPRAGGPWSAVQLGAAVAQLIQELKLVRDVLITSFDPFVLAEVRRLEPQVAVGFLTCRESHLNWLRQRALRHLWLNDMVQPDILAPDQELWEPDLAAMRRRQGYRLCTWTVDDPSRMEQLIEMGVLAIISNHPDRVAAVADKMRHPGQTAGPITSPTELLE